MTEKTTLPPDVYEQVFEPSLGEGALSGSRFQVLTEEQRKNQARGSRRQSYYDRQTQTWVTWFKGHIELH